MLASPAAFLPLSTHCLACLNGKIPPEEDLGLEGPFWLPPDLGHQSHAVPPSASIPEPRRSKRMLSIAGYYAALAGKSPQKARK
jgi:hypothetical protein